mmetsp:Transcript_26795/g.68878  ORF Transcript_26795/g.68878 Transcript_26795/m.68878 type:complete len:86 (-) Transcript_26795:170-427(-)
MLGEVEEVSMRIASSKRRHFDEILQRYGHPTITRFVLAADPNREEWRTTQEKALALFSLAAKARQHSAFPLPFSTSLHTQPVEMS